MAKSLLDPEVPANAGYYRTLDITAPPGSVVGPVPPAAIGCRSISASVLGDVIAAALSQALPDKALAGSGPHHLYVLSGTDPRTGTYFVNYETLAGGMGARANRDGVDGVRVHASGSSNLPVEALEHAYPFRVERYALWDDSAGAGRYRGGMGVIARLPRARRRHRGEPLVGAAARRGARRERRRAAGALGRVRAESRARPMSASFRRRRPTCALPRGWCCGSARRRRRLRPSRANAIARRSSAICAKSASPKQHAKGVYR